MPLHWWEQKNIIDAEVGKVKQKAQAALGYYKEQQRQRDVSWVGQIERQQARATQEKEMWRGINQQRLQAQAVQELKNASHALTMAGFGIDKIPITPQTIQAQMGSGFTMAQGLVRQAEHEARAKAQEERTEAQVKVRTKVVTKLIKEGALTGETSPEDIEPYIQAGIANEYYQEALRAEDYVAARQWAERVKETQKAIHMQTIRKTKWYEPHKGEFWERVKMGTGIFAKEKIPKWVSGVQQPERPEDIAMMGVFPESLQLRKPEPLVYEGREEMMPVMIPSREQWRAELTAKYRKPEITQAIQTALDYAFYPFTATGMWNREMTRIDKALGSDLTRRIRLGEELSEEDKEKVAQQVQKTFADTPAIEKIKAWLPGGEKHKEFRQLPILEQLYYEAPAWILFCAVVPSATSLRAKLAPVAAKPGVTGVAAQVTRGALAPVAGYEWAIGKVITLPIKGASAVTNKVVTAYVKKHAVYLSGVARRPALSAKERLLQKVLAYHGRWLTQMSDNVLKARGASVTARAAGEMAEKTATQKQILLLDSGIRNSTKTMDNIVSAVRAGKELTPESLTALIVKNTPDDFAKGIGDIIAGRVVPGLAKEVTPIVAGVVKPVTEVGAGVAPTKLRSTIMAWGKQRGLSQIQLNEIFKKVVGTSETGRQLPYHLTRMTPEQLRETLTKVKVARPRRIRGKVVITEKTESKIQSLKSNLASKGQMDDENFARLLKDLKLKTVGYETSGKFITESEGKGLIRAMLDEADTIGWQSKVDAGLAKHPNMASAVDTLKTRIVAQKIATLDKKPVGANPLLDMRYYTMTLQQKTGKPLYETWQALNNKRLGARYRRMGYMEQLRQSTPKYIQISRDEKALKRVSDYIAAKNKLGPKTPVNITKDEIALANEIERQLYELRGVVRFVRFDNAYDIYGADAKRIKDLEIKDAPIKDLREAIDIYEGQGKDALIKYLGTKDWGIIKSGYEPLSVVNPRIYLFRPRVTTLGKGHIKTRTSIEYPEQDRNILQRYNSYLKQILNLQELASPVRTFARAFDESAYMLKNPRTTASDVSRAINEMKGYSDIGGPAARLIARVYAQTMAAVFWDPYKWIRNLCQNIAFHPDRHLAFDPRNIALTAQEKLYSDIFVSQKLGMMYEYLMRGEKPFPGLGRITRLANKTSRYPLTDETNRRISFWLRINKVNRATKGYREHGDINRLTKDAGLDDLELLQKKEALEMLSQDVVDYGVPGLENVSGEEAFARYIAREVTNNTHFMYERSLRSPASMGPLGRVLMNLATFPRSYAQRIILQLRRLKPGSGATGSEKSYGLKTAMGIIVCGTLIGEVFERVTGRKRNPYSPLTILGWTPGGLSIGVTQEITSCVWDIAGAAAGDKDALNRATTAIPRVSDLVLPFYGIIIDSLEAGTDTKNIDRYALRKLREKLDEEYETRGSAYRVKRNFFEKFQHALFGGEVDETKEKTQEELLQDYMDELAEGMK